VPERTPEGAKRSGALGGFAESCAGGLSWHNRPGEGETKSIVSAGMKRQRNEVEALLNYRADARKMTSRARFLIPLIERRVMSLAGSKRGQGLVHWA
jgi:hypothetical protein